MWVDWFERDGFVRDFVVVFSNEGVFDESWLGNGVDSHDFVYGLKNNHFSGSATYGDER